MFTENKIWIANGMDNKICLYPEMLNRHGLITGATGTGKTVTLRVLAESLSALGVPVFMADVKGDLATICQKGTVNESVKNRLSDLLIDENDFPLSDFPVNLWDIYGEKGIFLRTTISEMGPVLLSRILGLNATQSDLLTVIFKIADDEELLLIDSKDLRAMLQYVGEHAKEYSLSYGNIAKASIAAIIRAVIALEAEGGDLFFGEPALNLSDWFATNADGKGCIQILDCQKLVQNPTMYASFHLWLLSELFELLPEVGDLKKPRMVFFFDEAHLLFSTAPKELLMKIEQVIKLIRSKGVGIFFITQNPKDIPDGVLAQLGNKIQHALHAYTPSEQKAVKAAAQSFRPNPDFDTFEAITSLEIGEALISVLDDSGIPTIVEKGKILPPQSKLGALDDEIRNTEILNNMLSLRYNQALDRDSAYEFLQRQAEIDAYNAQMEKERIAVEKQAQKEAAAQLKALEKERLSQQREAEKKLLARQKALEKQAAANAKRTRSAVKSVANTAAGTIGRELGNQLGSSLGGKFGKRLGGNVGASLGRGIIGTFLKL